MNFFIWILPKTEVYDGLENFMYMANQNRFFNNSTH